MGILDGRLALVTGGGTGIGQGIAIELAREGADVAIHFSSSAEGARQTAAEIERLGRRSVLIQGDLGKVGEAKRVVDEAAGGLAGLDILVNNSGITRSVPLLELTEELYDEVLGINLRAQFFCAKTAIPYMVKRGGGSILNITSVHGGVGSPNHTVYSASKGGIIAFTRALALELAPLKIRVNSLGPGLIEVPRYFTTMPGYDHESSMLRVPWGRVGTPEDVGRVAAFFASDRADFVTGQNLYVDGGTMARMNLTPFLRPS